MKGAEVIVGMGTLLPVVKMVSEVVEHGELLLWRPFFRLTSGAVPRVLASEVALLPALFLGLVVCEVAWRRRVVSLRTGRGWRGWVAEPRGHAFPPRSVSEGIEKGIAEGECVGVGAQNRLMVVYVADITGSDGESSFTHVAIFDIADEDGGDLGALPNLVWRRIVRSQLLGSHVLIEVNAEYRDFLVALLQLLNVLMKHLVSFCVRIVLAHEKMKICREVGKVCVLDALLNLLNALFYVKEIELAERWRHACPRHVGRVDLPVDLAVHAVHPRCSAIVDVLYLASGVDGGKRKLVVDVAYVLMEQFALPWRHVSTVLIHS